MPVKNIEEAVRLADDSDFGLGASIYTNNLEYAMYAMENIHAGLSGSMIHLPIMMQARLVV